MKMKYYLRGFGTGMILATVIMICSFSIRERINDNQSSKNEETLLDHKESTLNETKTNENKEETETQTGTASFTINQSTIQNETTISNETTIENETTKKNETESFEDTQTKEYKELTSNAQNPSVEDTITLSVTEGMSSRKVASELERLGVVEDGDDFDNYLNEHNYEAKIRVGEYQIKKGLSYQSIADILIRR